MQTTGNRKTGDTVCSNVEVYTSASIIRGILPHYSNLRLLDILNRVMAEPSNERKDFLHIQEASVNGLDEDAKFMESVYVNRHNILFIKEIDNSDIYNEHKKPDKYIYPYVEKQLVSIKFYLPFYTITGYMHCSKGRGPVEALKSNINFFPLTDVKIISNLGIGETTSKFVAVNRAQILYIGTVVS